VVNSSRKDTVWTAGHCVHGGPASAGGTGTWHRNWTFVPAFKNDVRPFGTWVADRLTTRTRWVNRADFAEDLGAAVLRPLNGRKIVNVLGGQGIAWNYPGRYAAVALGYPAEPPFDGRKLAGCTGTTRQFAPAFDPRAIALFCDLTRGSSGGAWLRNVNSRGLGYINGEVSTGAWPAYPGYLFSPYYGEAVRSLYFYVVNEV
jgi:hypothetical protein